MPSGIGQRGGGKTSAFRTREQASIGIRTPKLNVPLNEVADGLDHWNLACPLGGIDSYSASMGGCLE
jgi:hypothetical protein